jgi:glycyl-tRNA synthetase
MEKIVSLCKRRGFIYQSGEFVWGLNGCWGLRPLGVELKRNLKEYWWRRNVQERDDIVGLDGAILTMPQVLVASGTSGGLRTRWSTARRARGGSRRTRWDVPVQGEAERVSGAVGEVPVDGAAAVQPTFETKVGASATTDDAGATAYLRPETAQSIFVQFRNVVDSSRVKLPFGIAQVGKSFRNEINPRNFTFRSRSSSRWRSSTSAGRRTGCG